MNRLQAPVARLFGSLFTAVALVGLVAGCGSRSRELQPGSYRAVLDLPGGELPFGLDVAQEEAGFVLTVINGDERVRITDVSVADGQLTATMPGPFPRGSVQSFCVQFAKHRPVAQLAERRSPKPQVGGSIPSWPASRASR